VNITTDAEFFSRLRERAAFRTRLLGRSASVSLGWGSLTDAVGRVYIINLDRKPDRWRRMSREVGRMRDKDGRSLAAMTRRFSAVDARYLDDPPIVGVVSTRYSLADQFFVQPIPALGDRSPAHTRLIAMTPQEVAVALSHIEVWRQIAAGGCHYTLVLEDDTYFTRRFVPLFDTAWAELMARRDEGVDFDLLYLSYREAGGRAKKNPVSDLLFEPVTGLWQLSGYVLSRGGAEKLLGLLPVRGPVDLWINHQFRGLDAIAIKRSIIEQRPDALSSNSYSVLPVLSEIGVLSRERPLLAKRARLPGPVFAYGGAGSGLSALAMALSMLGYRCYSDVTHLPLSERARVWEGKRDIVFNAYVNVGSFAPHTWTEVARRYRNARFIFTTDGESRSTSAAHGISPTTAGSVAAPGAASTLTSVDPLPSAERPPAQLVLPVGHPDKWQLLSELLGCEYPAHAYPEFADQPQRLVADDRPDRASDATPQGRLMKADRSPWIAPRAAWNGVALHQTPLTSQDVDVVSFQLGSSQMGDGVWWLRDDTFPSNLTLFSPRNVALNGHGVAELILREERSPVRDYTSGSIASRRRFRYGRFVADIRPAGVHGLITGMFLHRNSPRQEIDIEFLGKDPTKMLVNVYYNPGQEGTKLEYGYRGTPVLVDLGFDSAEDFHRYEIEWRSTSIRWRVDGRLVHERVNWDPTPVPHLPMQFNVNLWYSRSRELGGALCRDGLPARALVQRIRIESEVASVREQSPGSENGRAALSLARSEADQSETYAEPHTALGLDAASPCRGGRPAAAGPPSPVKPEEDVDTPLDSG
jgi:GR25 family glycosyltransferase involved in LPS biosynthesis